MARVVPFHPSLQPSGIAVAPRAGSIVGTATAVGAVLYMLAALGGLVFRAIDRLDLAFARWMHERRERAEDHKLWQLALADSRVMADLVALQQHAPRQGSAWF